MSSFVFSRKPITIAEGDGVHLYDEDGTEYLDFGASYACVPLGHGHEAVQSAVRDQMDRLTFVQASYPVATRETLYERLAATAPGDIDSVWLCNSGTEANEAALKFARSATGNTKFVATMRAFHGRTFGSLSLTWKKKYRKHYEPLLDDVEFVPYGDSEALADAIDDDTAAVLLEPVQGEGGINPADEEFLQTARVHTATEGAALVFDEVQTGLGRTGALWSFDRFDVLPDMVTTAKGLANGLPMGATLCRDWIADDYGNHGSTFSGGPAVAAAAEATVSTIVEEDLPAHAAAVGDYLVEGIEDRLGDAVREVRGEGLMIGIEVGRGANRVLRDLAMDHRILALPAGRTVVRLLPPLTVGEDHADALVDALEDVLVTQEATS